MDVVVVGGGAVGLSVAYCLAREGVRVTLVEQGEPGRGSSCGNAGMIVPSYSLPLGARRGLLQGARWLVERLPSASGRPATPPSCPGWPASPPPVAQEGSARRSRCWPAWWPTAPACIKSLPLKRGRTTAISRRTGCTSNRARTVWRRGWPERGCSSRRAWDRPRSTAPRCGRWSQPCETGCWREPITRAAPASIPSPKSPVARGHPAQRRELAGSWVE